MQTREVPVEQESGVEQGEIECPAVIANETVAPVQLFSHEVQQCALLVRSVHEVLTNQEGLVLKDSDPYQEGKGTCPSSKATCLSIDERGVAEVKELRGIIPICSSCKKIRDDKGYWNQVEKYIEEHTNAQFTHGICESCIGKLYGD